MRNNERWIKSILIGAIISGLRVLLTSWFPNGTVQAILEPSPLYKTGLYLPILFFIGWIIYSLMTYSYLLIDFRMPGPKNFKVYQFVLCELLIWLLYSSEPLPHIIGMDWLVTPLKHMILFLVQALLLKLLLARERLMYQPKQLFYPRGLAIFAIIFALFRLVSYVGFGIYALADSQLIFSITWSLTMGFAIGLCFSVLQRYLLRQDRKGKASQFSLKFFALNSVGYHLFFILRYDISLADIITRSGIDILAVWMAAYIVVNWQVEEGTPVRRIDDLI